MIKEDQLCDTAVMEHQISSAHNASSNGLAEQNLGSLKILFKKEIMPGRSLEQALSIYHNTPWDVEFFWKGNQNSWVACHSKGV